jgi:hypothetical protein
MAKELGFGITAPDTGDTGKNINLIVLGITTTWSYSDAENILTTKHYNIAL